jgi:hypothetical protein
MASQRTLATNINFVPEHIVFVCWDVACIRKCSLLIYYSNLKFSFICCYIQLYTVVLLLYTLHNSLCFTVNNRLACFLTWKLQIMIYYSTLFNSWFLLTTVMYVTSSTINNTCNSLSYTRSQCMLEWFNIFQKSVTADNLRCQPLTCLLLHYAHISSRILL